MVELAIRTATPDDVDAIACFAEVTIHDTYDRLVGLAYAEELLRDWWGTSLLQAIGADRVIVAVDGNDVVGLVHVDEFDGEPVIWKLYVSPDRRNDGLGARLVRHVVEHLPSGRHRLLTEHIAANLRAAQFYQREGFEVVRTVESDDPQTATVWRSKALDAERDSTDWGSYVRTMEITASVESPLERDIAQWLAKEPGRRIADVGCGVGSMAVHLAGAFPDAEIVAGDLTEAMLVATRARILATGLSHRVAVRPIDLTVAAADDRFDLVWASAVIHHLADQVAGLSMLRDRVRPAGRLALAEGGLRIRRLPWDLGVGRPGLEGRLDRAGEEMFGRLRTELASAVPAPHGWPRLLRDAGFDRVRSRTFLLDHSSPVSAAVIDVVVEQLAEARARYSAAGLLAADDDDTLRQLTDERSDHFVARRDDVFYLTAATVHLAYC